MFCVECCGQHISASSFLLPWSAAAAFCASCVPLGPNHCGRLITRTAIFLLVLGIHACLTILKRLDHLKHRATHDVIWFACVECNIFVFLFYNSDHMIIWNSGI